MIILIFLLCNFNFHNKQVLPFCLKFGVKFLYWLSVQFDLLTGDFIYFLCDL